ncbi:hypothetical protein TGME49_255300 [Toxoplasma gondii ME49]|uniref:Uncharacterized protein n=3 Tax=Toxoplasma gondii TaxID=5811 RepID=A0A125YSZ3_TOXGV|nr:hypothetical protein TGME49_255300 [Toxoplasma gondii ME49]EPT29143.1 hypothetical protein TGME49_255300 [Toxoplasma gondii ME49]ESS35486.1 hypothetical protein TGVEG_255300 [Toxoplasma gondii VEG]CEL74660.1 TPA: hypothetical protein BN1205_079060 [Toxoplasma gondii VEG]|eukprot:XP_018636933.1 hypothetical protein TGME49_255300 [Toxoplasma gondii ME49]
MSDFAFPGKKTSEGRLRSAELVSLLRQLQCQSASGPSPASQNEGSHRSAKSLASSSSGVSMALLQLLQQRQQQEQKELLLRLAEDGPQAPGRERTTSAARAASRQPGLSPAHAPTQLGTHPATACALEPTGSGLRALPASGVSTADGPPFSESRPREEGQALKQLFVHLMAGNSQGAPRSRQLATNKDRAAPASSESSNLPSDLSDEASSARGLLRDSRRGEPSPGSTVPPARPPQSASDSDEMKSDKEGARPFPLAAPSRRLLPSHERDGEQETGSAGLEDLSKLKLQQQRHERLLRQQLAALTKLQNDLGGKDRAASAATAFVSTRPGDSGSGTTSGKAQAALMQQHQALLQQQRQQVQQYLIEGAVAGAASAGAQRGEGAKGGPFAGVSPDVLRHQAPGFKGSREPSQGRMGDLSALSSLTQQGLLGTSGPSAAALKALQQRLAAAAAAGAAAAGGSLGVDTDVSSSDHDAQLLSKLQQSVAVASYNLLRLSSPSSADAASVLRGLGETLGRIGTSRNGESLPKKTVSGDLRSSASVGGVGPGGPAAYRHRSEPQRDSGLSGGRPPLPVEALELASAFLPQSRGGGALSSGRKARAASETDVPHAFAVPFPARNPTSAAAAPPSSLDAASALCPPHLPSRHGPASAQAGVSGDTSSQAFRVPRAKSPDDSTARERAAAAARAAAVSAAAAVVEPPLDPTRERVLRKHVKALRPYFEATFAMPGFFGGARKEGERKGAADEPANIERGRLGGENTKAEQAHDCGQKERPCATPEPRGVDARTLGDSGSDAQRADEQMEGEGQVDGAQPKEERGEEKGVEKELPGDGWVSENGERNGEQKDGSEGKGNTAVSSGPHNQTTDSEEKGEQKRCGNAGEGTCLGTRGNPQSRVCVSECGASMASGDGLPPLVASLDDQLPPFPLGSKRSASKMQAASGAQATPGASAPSRGVSDSPHLSVLRWRADASFLFYDAVQHLREQCGLAPDPVVSRLLSRHPRQVRREASESKKAAQDSQKREGEKAASAAGAGAQDEGEGGEKREPRSSASMEGDSSRSLAAAEKADAVDSEAEPLKEKENENSQTQYPPSLADVEDSVRSSAFQKLEDAPETGPKGSCERPFRTEKEAGPLESPDSDGSPEDEALWDGGPPATERWCSALIGGWAAGARQTRGKHGMQEKISEDSQEQALTRECRSTTDATPELKREIAEPAMRGLTGDIGDRDVGRDLVEAAGGSTRDSWKSLQAEQERLEDLTMPHVDIQRLPLEWPRSLAAVCSKALQQPDAEKSHSSLVAGVWDTVWGACRHLWTSKRPRLCFDNPDELGETERAEEGASKGSEAAKEGGVGEVPSPRKAGRDSDSSSTPAGTGDETKRVSSPCKEALEGHDEEETCLVCEALWAAAASFPDGEEEWTAERRPFRHFGRCPAYALSGGKFRVSHPTDVGPSAIPVDRKTEPEIAERTPQRRLHLLQGEGPQDKSPRDEGEAKCESASRDGEPSASASVEKTEAADGRGSAGETKAEEDASEGSPKSLEKRTSERRVDNSRERFWLAHAHQPVAVDVWRPPLALLEELFVSEVEHEVGRWRVQDIRDRRRQREEEDEREARELRERLGMIQRRKAEAEKAEREEREDPRDSTEIEGLFEVDSWEEECSRHDGRPGPAEDEKESRDGNSAVCVASLGSDSCSPEAPKGGSEGAETLGDAFTQAEKSLFEKTREEAKKRCVDAWKGALGEREAQAVRWIKRTLGSRALRRAACGLSPLPSVSCHKSSRTMSPCGAEQVTVKVEPQGHTSNPPAVLPLTPTQTLSLRFVKGTEEDGWAVFAASAEKETGYGSPGASAESPEAPKEEENGGVPCKGKDPDEGGGLLRRFPLASLGFFHGCRLALELMREKGKFDAEETQSRESEAPAPEEARRQSDALREEEEELRCLLAQHSAGASSSWRWWREFTAEKEEENLAVSALSQLPPLFSLAERTGEAEEEAPAPSEDEKPVERTLPSRTTRSSRLLQEKLAQLNASRASSSLASSLGSSAPATPQAENGKAGRAGAGASQRGPGGAATGQGRQAGFGASSRKKKIRVLVVGRDDVSDVTQDCREWLLRRLRLFGPKRARSGGAAPLEGRGADLSLLREMRGETQAKRRKVDQAETGEETGSVGEETGPSGTDRRPADEDGGVSSVETADDVRGRGDVKKTGGETGMSSSPTAGVVERGENAFQESKSESFENFRGRRPEGEVGTWREGVRDEASSERVEKEGADACSACRLRCSGRSKKDLSCGKEDQEEQEDTPQRAVDASSSQEEGPGAAVVRGKRKRTEHVSQVSTSSSSGRATRLLLERLCELRAHASGVGPYSGGERLLLRFQPEASCSASPCEEKSEDGGADSREPGGAWSSEGEDARGPRDREASARRHTANTYSLRHRRRCSHSPVLKGHRQSPSSSSRQHARAAAYAAQDACRQRSPDASPSDSREAFSFSLSHLRGGRVFGGKGSTAGLAHSLNAACSPRHR